MNKPLRPGPKNSWVCDLCGKKIRNAMFGVRNDIWF